MRKRVLPLLVSLFLTPAAPVHVKAAQVFPLSRFEMLMEQRGFTDVQRMDSTIRVELKYACPKNFMGCDVYGELRRCFLRPEAAEKLVKASRYLKERHPDLSLLVVDGLRPRHVQRRMWSLVKDTPMRRYVANPRTGSMHNYGCAVDITIVDKDGKRLDMGTPVDHFGPLSQPRLEKRYLRQGKLTAEQLSNRLILRAAMTAAGFRQLPIEWWHFDAFAVDTVRQRYAIVE